MSRKSYYFPVHSYRSEMFPIFDNINEKAQSNEVHFMKSVALWMCESQEFHCINDQMWYNMHTKRLSNFLFGTILWQCMRLSTISIVAMHIDRRVAAEGISLYDEQWNPVLNCCWSLRCSWSIADMVMIQQYFRHRLQNDRQRVAV